MAGKTADFASEYFSIEKLENGIYAAIEKEGSETGSNAAIVDMGNYTVVFDTFLNIDAAADLRKACIELTGREASFIINSHSHMDHIMGNQVFGSEARIISSSCTRDIMATDRREIKDMQNEYRNGIKETEESLKTETEKARILDLKSGLMYMKNLVKAGLEIRLPDITFDKELVLYGTGRVMHIIACNAAHCLGNTVAYLPKEKICLTGDLLLKGVQPPLAEGDPDNVIAELEKFMEIGVNYYIPGHGGVATNRDVKLQMQYIKEIKKLAADKINEEGHTFSVDELPEVFRDWNELCFLSNISALTEKLKKGR